MLLAPGNLSVHAMAAQDQLQLLGNPVDRLPAFTFAQPVKTGGNRLIGIRFKMLEGEGLHLLHKFIHADPLGERRIDIHRLTGDAATLFLTLDEVERAHIVEPVRQLDEQHPDIAGHGEQEFPQIFGSAFGVGLRLNCRQLGNAINKPRDILAKQLLDLVLGRDGIFDRVVEDRRRDRLIIEPQIRQDTGDFDRMAEIGIARGAFLRAMCVHRKHIGAVDQSLISPGVIAFDPFNQFILPQHPTKMAGCWDIATFEWLQGSLAIGFVAGSELFCGHGFAVDNKGRNRAELANQRVAGVGCAAACLVGGTVSAIADPRGVADHMDPFVGRFGQGSPVDGASLGARCREQEGDGGQGEEDGESALHGNSLS